MLLQGGDEKNEKTEYHLFATEEANHCGMTRWKSNSQVIHAVAASPGGPYTRVGLALPFATNPSVFFDATAKVYRMLVLPTGTAAKQKNCTSPHTHFPAKEAELILPLLRFSSSVSSSPSINIQNESNISRQLFVSTSLNGPWTASITSDIPPCNNPSGAIHPHTGAAWLLCHGPSPKGYGPGIFIHNATSWSTATSWSAWSGGYDILRGVVGEGVREGACEDPSLSIDPRTGYFHVLAHCYSTTAFNGTDPGKAYCAGHIWSRDGTPGTY